MSKKLKTRLILVVVLAIWGNIAFRVFKNYQVGQELEENQPANHDPSFSAVNFKKDSFNLVLPDVDPFLKHQIRTEPGISANSDNKPHNSNVRKDEKKDNDKEPKVTKIWPQISYLGFVKNHDNTDALCLLQINGNMLKVSEGDQEAGVLVTRVFRDSIHLVFSGEEKTFVKG